MYLGRVIGTVVATRIYEGLEGKKLLLVDPLDHHLKSTGEAQVAVDTVRAGPGELVYLVGSREAALALDPWFVPVDAAIVGIVDQLDAEGRPRPPTEFHRGRAPGKPGAMRLCRVQGTVVATEKHPAFAARKLMVVQPLDEHGAEKGASFIAVDMVQAGTGDLVLVNSEGNGNRQILKMGDIIPIRSLIVGIVDRVDVEPAAPAAPAVEVKA